MSFDIFFQRFDDTKADAAAVLAVLEPLVVDRDERFDFVRVATSDGEANVYMSDPREGATVNRPAGRAVWDMMYDLAVAGRFVVLPVGCGTCVPDEAMLGDLPDYLPAPFRVIRSGADLLAAVEEA